MSTLTIPPHPTSPQEDVAMLRQAFKGWGCDTAAVINILAHRDAVQRFSILQEYRVSKKDNDFLKRLQAELSGPLENAILLWMHDPAGRDATVIRDSFIKGSLGGATEVICSRTPSQLHLIKEQYYIKFGVFLEKDIESHCSADHKKLLVAYVSFSRYEGLEIDKEMAKTDAMALYKAGEKVLGTDEKIFIRICSERSRAQLVATNYSYLEMYGHTFKRAVKKETSGRFAQGLLAILACAENPAKYFAKVLFKAMKGLGTNEAALVRVIVTRTELDMKYIKAEYLKKYRKTLNDAIHSETSSHFRTFLITLLGPG